MNIDKAIEILDDLAIPGEVLLDSVDVDALRLGIEALRRVKGFRKSPLIGNPLPLPGETE